MPTSPLTPKPIAQAKPFEVRDFSKGRVSKKAVNTALAPANSVSLSTNVNFDTIIGSAVVRPGSTLLGAAVTSGETPLGFTSWSVSGGATNGQVVVYTGASTATLYYFSDVGGGTWDSGLTGINNTHKVRFAQLGGSLFKANGVDAMQDSANLSSWGTTNSTFSGDSVIPSLLFRTSGMMLAGGWSTYKDRVYFSSVIDPTTSPFITWNSDSTTGDWIDIDPDDGGYITGFAETSSNVLIFKNNGMYRLDAINRTVDPDLIVNVGAASQEAITTCQGVVYFYSGNDIRQTTGSYPDQISRLGVQDYLDAIPLANRANVSAGTDGLAVWWSIGNITLYVGRGRVRTYNNIVLKFSTRDQSWSIHSYAQQPRFFSQYINNTKGIPLKCTFADTSGNVQMLDYGVTDGEDYVGDMGTPIFFELESQELDMGNRAYTDKVSDQVAVFTNYGLGTQFQMRADDDDWQDIDIDLSTRVAVGQELALEGNSISFRWFGTSSGTAPIFEGMYLEHITELGLTLLN